MNDFSNTPLADYASCGSCYSQPTIDTAMFPNTVGNVYWTSSSYAPDTTSAWLIYFDYGKARAGDVASPDKISTHYLRCVATGP